MAHIMFWDYIRDRLQALLQTFSQQTATQKEKQVKERN